jgi:hypothetical protein
MQWEDSTFSKKHWKKEDCLGLTSKLLPGHTPTCVGQNMLEDGRRKRSPYTCGGDSGNLGPWGPYSWSTLVDIPKSSGFVIIVKSIRVAEIDKIIYIVSRPSNAPSWPDLATACTEFFFAIFTGKAYRCLVPWGPFWITRKSLIAICKKININSTHRNRLLFYVNTQGPNWSNASNRAHHTESWLKSQPLDLLHPSEPWRRSWVKSNLQHWSIEISWAI